MNAQQVFEDSFLRMRHRLLEMAADLDRIDRADGKVDDVRAEQIRRAIEVLLSVQPRRIERIHDIFSL